MWTEWLLFGALLVAASCGLSLPLCVLAYRLGYRDGYETAEVICTFTQHRESLKQ